MISILSVRASIMVVMLLFPIGHMWGAIVLMPLPGDDPRVRCPDIRFARETLGWSPTIGLQEGLVRIISWFRPNI